MDYTLRGRSLLGLEADKGHVLEAYSIRVAKSTARRWAETRCSCGQRARARWEEPTADYRSLVTVAWFDACGVRAFLGAESLRR